MIALPRPPFAHLLALSDRRGVFEHACGAVPRREHGYCTDDVARALVAILREPLRPPALERLASTCLAFVSSAQLPDGRFRSRLSSDGHWLAEPGSNDTVGRALLGLAVAATSATSPANRRSALARFDASAGFDADSPRANALATLAAAEVLEGIPGHAPAERLLETSAVRLGSLGEDDGWPWPEARLAYANALLAEGRIAAGVALGEPRRAAEGLGLLEWLVRVESKGSRFSFTPVGGWAPGEPRPGFDQQPIEAVAMAEACSRAFAVTGEPQWAETTLRAAAWFLGENDAGAFLLNLFTGGCHDGLEPGGCNLNQGAESTLAMIGALQHARRLQAAARSAPTISRASTVAAPTHRSAAPYVR
ncbi:MAG TPA: hypothetical protein VFL61_01945 [Gaiellaceae bacterium]|nr:hypothetical protein [Gaiellaceae bacterium]